MGASTDSARCCVTSGSRRPVPTSLLAATDPIGYVHALSAASEAGELVASPGLGDLLWVLRDHR